MVPLAAPNLLLATQNKAEVAMTDWLVPLVFADWALRWRSNWHGFLLTWHGHMAHVGPTSIVNSSIFQGRFLLVRELNCKSVIYESLPSRCNQRTGADGFSI